MDSPIVAAAAAAATRISPGQVALDALTASARKKNEALAGHQEKRDESKARAKKAKRELRSKVAVASSVTDFQETACLAETAANAVEAYQSEKVFVTARKLSAKKDQDAADEMLHAREDKQADERMARRLERELRKLPPNAREKQRKQWEQLGFISRTAVAGARTAVAGEADARVAAYRPMSTARERCTMCTLMEFTAEEHADASMRWSTMKGCRCHHFPMALPLGLAFGDAVTVTVDESHTENATLLYFVPKGTVDGLPFRHAMKARDGNNPTTADAIVVILDSNVQRIMIEGRFNFASTRWSVVPADCVSLDTVVDLTGWRIRAPSRYEPERVAASRLITADERRACFDRTLSGEHRCFCCLAVLVFTMEEEFTTNVGHVGNDVAYVRCHEAGHVLAHSIGKPVIGDRVNELWNVIPLCHSCNVRMGRMNAFSFIEKANPERLMHQTYQSAKLLFEQKCPPELLRW